MKEMHGMAKMKTEGIYYYGKFCPVWGGCTGMSVNLPSTVGEWPIFQGHLKLKIMMRV